jgi:hypothetical protein
MRSAIAIKTIGTQQRTINPIECDAIGCSPSFGAGRGVAVELADSAAPAGLSVLGWWSCMIQTSWPFAAPMFLDLPETNP